VSGLVIFDCDGVLVDSEPLARALKPFADHPEFQAPDDWPVTVIDRNGPTGAPVAGVTAGDFRRAKAAMRHNVELTGVPPTDATKGG
jgi:beta-phosphoglucomutase-like phosphatase (HAD superfamily)